MEVHDPPNHPLCERVCTSATGQIEFLSTCPTTRLQKPNIRIAASLDRGNASEQSFWGRAEILSRGVFDKEVRRKPLAFAADAGYSAGYEI